MRTRNSNGVLTDLNLFNGYSKSVLSINKKPRKTKNGLLYDVQLKIMRDDWCENGWKYQNLEKNAKSFAGMPILCAYIKDKITGEYKNGDGHNQKISKDKNGNPVIDIRSEGCEEIVGKINDNEDEIIVKEENGKNWIFAKGILYAWYHPQLVEQIKELGVMDISAETLINTDTKIFDEEKQGEIFPDWVGTGVTILGEDVSPAMPEANIKLIVMSKKQKIQEIENMSVIDKKGSQKNIKGEIEKVGKKLELKDFKELFPQSKLLQWSEDSGELVMFKDKKFMSYKFDKDIMGKEDFELKSMTIDDNNFKIMETQEKSKKTVTTLSTVFNNEEIDVDVDDDSCKCDECGKKQETIDEMKKDNDEMKEKIKKLNEKIEEYEKEKLNNKILESVMKEKELKEYDGIEEGMKVPEEKMQELLNSIKNGKYSNEEDAVKDYKVLFADTMEKYNKERKDQSQVFTMGIISRKQSKTDTEDPFEYAKERFGTKK